MNEQIMIRQNTIEDIVDNDLKRILQPLEKLNEFKKEIQFDHSASKKDQIKKD